MTGGELRYLSPEALMGGLGQLWIAGVPIDWSAHHRPAHPRKVPLPTYPFERQRYWIDRPRAAIASGAPAEFGRTAGGNEKVWIERFKRLAPICRDNNVTLVVKQHGGETGWILETNVPMNRGMEAMGGEIVKTYRIYEADL